MLRTLWNDDYGFVLSAELVLILTVGVLAMVVGLHAVAKAINHELVDLASAFGNLSQGYEFSGFLITCAATGRPNAAVEGSAFDDRDDLCDCAVLVHVPAPIKTDGTPGGNG